MNLFDRISKDMQDGSKSKSIRAAAEDLYVMYIDLVYASQRDIDDPKNRIKRKSAREDIILLMDFLLRTEK